MPSFCCSPCLCGFLLLCAYLRVSFLDSSTSAAGDTRTERQVNQPSLNSAPTPPPSVTRVSRQWVPCYCLTYFHPLIVVFVYMSWSSWASSRKLHSLLPVKQIVSNSSRIINFLNSNPLTWWVGQKGRISLEQSGLLIKMPGDKWNSLYLYFFLFFFSSFLL